MYIHVMSEPLYFTALYDNDHPAHPNFIELDGRNRSVSKLSTPSMTSSHCACWRVGVKLLACVGRLEPQSDNELARSCWSVGCWLVE